jgi:hypothetical protein
LLAGWSLTALFAKLKPPPADSSSSSNAALLIKIYHTLTLVSFSMSVSAALVATSANVFMLNGDFDQKAESAFSLLLREFDYEFVMTRWCFITAILSFLVAVTIRALIEFNLLRRERRTAACGVICYMTAVVLHVLSHVNQHCAVDRGPWPHFGSLTIYTSKLILRQVWRKGDGEGLHHEFALNPLQLVSVLSGVVALFFLARSIAREVMNTGMASTHPKSD